MTTPKVIIVTGGRAYDDSESVDAALSAQMPFDTLIHGAAPGADRLCAQWAFARGIQAVSVPAEWELHGNAAGPIRNNAMMAMGAGAQRDGETVVVLAFPGGRGTDDAIERAERKGLTVVRIPPAP